MFVGHYSAAFAIKSKQNKIPLWVLFVAVQLLDFLWAPFVLLGIEKMRITPGITAANPLDLYYMPYTHSLVGALVWSGVAFGVYKTISGRTASYTAAWIVALAVFSHWILDLIVHRPDLAIYDDAFKVGFGLWNYKGLEFGLEIAILTGGILIFFRRNVVSSRMRRFAIIIFGSLLVLIQAGNTFGSRPLSSDRAVAITALISYVVFAVTALFLEDKKRRKS
jgi:hypothetical protein